LSTLLVVAGEASGDRAAAAVVSHLRGVEAFGLGGSALARAGVTIVDDMRAWTALGIGEVSWRLPRLLRAWHTLAAATRARKPRAALLVSYTEFNSRLAPQLHRAGVRVLWYGAPQVWAWRGRRVHSLRRSVDRMALMLPFEEPLWRKAGVDAHYFGHPALETAPLHREAARHSLAMAPSGAAVALLPGSRPHEVRRLLIPMLRALARVRSTRPSIDARVLVAPSLDVATRAWTREACRAWHVVAFDVDPSTGAMPVLKAFDAAVCASGTASLEATLARATPVVTYRVGLATELTARALLRTSHVALPNILLGRRAFPELLQRDATSDRIADALTDVLERRRELLLACDRVEEVLGSARTPSADIARALEPWLRPGPGG